MKKPIFILSIFILGYVLPAHSNTNENLFSRYPSWKTYVNDSNEKDLLLKKLNQIENFVQAHKGQDKIAVFDWDGTLYHEKIEVKQPSELKLISEGTELYYDYKKGSRNGKLHEAGQPVWHIWAISHATNKTRKYKRLNLIPQRLLGHLSASENFVNAVDYDNRLEGETFISKGAEVKMDEYTKFFQIATFEAGMKPKKMQKGVKAFLQDYPPCDYAFFPALDIFHRLVETGFKVWIVTGSNPYYVKPVIQEIAKQCKRADGTIYDFGYDNEVYNPDKDRMYGNFAGLNQKRTFSGMLDDSRVRYYASTFDPIANDFVGAGATRGAELAQKDLRYINNKFGKTITVGGYIENKEENKAMILVGNSGSDARMMEYVLRQEGALGIGINGMTDFLEANPDNTIALEMECKKETELH